MIHARPDYNRIQDPENKIGSDEPVFLLRAQDKLMEPMLLYYAQLTALIDGDEVLAHMALDHVDLVREWQDANPKRVKMADA